MIQFTKTSNGFLVAFSGNELFLDEGTISLPFNSLSLTIDKSDIATFRKSKNGDVFFSGVISNIKFGDTTATKQNIAGLFSNTCCDNGVDEELSQRVTALETTVGDSTSGLVKDVNDLETTVGDSTAGLVHDVSTMSSSVSSLQTTVGDNNSGLVKDVNDLETTIIDDERVTAEALTALRIMIEQIDVPI